MDAAGGSGHVHWHEGVKVRAQRPNTRTMAPLAHRGLWLALDQRNSLAAFRDAFSQGCGVELDVRDLDGTLVVSHDPPLAGALTFDAVVAAWREHDERAGALAINVKADGLDEMISEALRDTDPARSFVFDMSIPDALHYVCAGIPYFARHSEVEPEPALYANAAGVWLDDFAGWFISEERIATHLQAGKRVAVVSPELHGRDHEVTWSEWRRWDVWRSPDVLLCTDHPTRAQEVFA